MTRQSVSIQSGSAPASASGDRPVLPSRAKRPATVLLGSVALIVAAAATVRYCAAQDELWMDEIWTLLALGRNVHTPWGILTAHHDNNHYLMTFWMYLVSPQRNWFIYRLPSVVAGTVTVALAAQVARRWGRLAALAAALLTGASFVRIF
jgi:hypothetical protein